MNMTINKAVAIRISNLLREKHMTLYRLEQNSGISHRSMACIMNERNKTVTLTTVMLIAKGFDMSYLDFLNDAIIEKAYQELLKSN